MLTVVTPSLSFPNKIFHNRHLSMKTPIKKSSVIIMLQTKYFSAFFLSHWKGTFKIQLIFLTLKRSVLGAREAKRLAGSHSR